MNLKEIGFYLFMEEQEKKEKELEELRKVKAASYNNLVCPERTTKEKKEDQ